MSMEKLTLEAESRDAVRAAMILDIVQGMNSGKDSWKPWQRKMIARVNME